MATPDPLATPPPFALDDREHACRLWIMNDDEVVALGQLLGVVLALVLVNADHILGPWDFSPLQTGVGELRDREEWVASLDDLPGCVQPQLVHQGDVCEEELGHTAPERRGVEMQDPGPAHLSSGAAKVVDHLLAHDVRVILELTRRYRYGWKHVPTCPLHDG